MNKPIISRAFLSCLLAGLLGISTALGQPVDTDHVTKISQLLQQVDNLMTKSFYDSAIVLSKQALTLSKEKNFNIGEANSYDRLAEIMLLNGRMAEVSRYDSLVLPLATQLKDTALLISAYNRNGVYSMEHGKQKEAEQSFLQALDMGLEKKQSGKTAEVYSNLGSNYLATGDKDKAIEWFFKALRLFEVNKNEKGQGETYSNISSVYYLMGRVPDAISYQKKSIILREEQNDLPGLVITNTNIGQLYILRDSFPLAFQHLSRAVQHAEKINNPKLKGSAYSGMSAYYSRTKDFPSALKWQTQAIRLFEETDNKPLLSRLYVAAGNLANVSKDSVTAENFYNKALTLASQLGNKENISNAYDKLSTFYLSHNDYEKGYLNYKKHILYRDSIASNSTVAKIEEIRTRYETEKKDNEIARLNIEQRIRQLEIEKQKAIIAGNTLEATQKENEIKLLSQQRALQEAAFQKKEEELEKQLLVAKNSEQELRLSQQELKLSNQEKQLREKELKGQKLLRNFVIGATILLALFAGILFNRYKLKRKLEQQNQLLNIRNDISRNLHDDIGASLSNINILNELTKRNVTDPDKAHAYLAKAGDDIQRISESLSDIVWNINPQYDDLDNLFIRMKRYAADMFDGKDIAAQLVFPPATENIHMQMDQRRDFYLIFKEAVNNLVKYSRATEAKVEISSGEHSIHLRVADNGKGFDIKNTRQGNGIHNMKQRAEKWKAQLLVKTAVGEGTVISLDMKRSL
jgi:two-component system sensor histidine kinase UhpB